MMWLPSDTQSRILKRCHSKADESIFKTFLLLNLGEAGCGIELKHIEREMLVTHSYRVYLGESLNNTTYKTRM